MFVLVQDTAEAGTLAGVDASQSIRLGGSGSGANAAGPMAASARVAVVGADAVLDQVSTDPRHQPRGLATAMMSMWATAYTLGARRGVLLASDQGRAPYEELGRRLVSPSTAARFGP